MKTITSQIIFILCILNNCYSQNDKLCCDGGEFYFYYWNNDSTINLANVVIRVQADPQGNDPDQYGYFQITNVVPYNHVDAIFFRPTYLNASGQYTTRTMEAYYPPTGTVLGSWNWDFYRPPVLMIHGLWSDASTFDSMKSYLNSSYPPSLLSAPSYPSSISFSDNSFIVPSEIALLLNKARNNGFYVNKVDVIAHSMGGILSRLYIQSSSYNNNIQKLLTLNTPHSGAQTANLLLSSNPASIKLRKIIDYTLGFFGSNPVTNGAVNDLKVNSTAINTELNGSNLSSPNYADIPIHAITTTFSAGITDSSSAIDMILPIAAYFYGMSYSNFNDTLFNGETNDLVVSSSSQQGGINSQFTSTFSGITHSSTGSSPVESEIINLLNMNPNDQSIFCNTCFNPPVLDSVFRVYNLNAVENGNRTNQVDSIIFLNPSYAANFSSGDTININIQKSSGINSVGVIISKSFTDWKFIDTTTASNFLNINYVIPNNFIGSISIVTYGYDSMGVINYDSTYVDVNTLANLDSISLEVDTLKLYTGSIKGLKILGNFSDGTQRVINYVQGLSFSISDTSIAKYFTPNFILGQQPGIVIATVNYQSTTAQFIIEVSAPDSNFIQSIQTIPVEYNNFIVFPNPSNEAFNIKGIVSKNENFKMVLINVIGQPVISMETESINNIVDAKLNLNELPQGIYFLIVTSSNFKQIYKVLKQ